MQNECSPEIEREARAWVADCDWADLDADAVDDLPLAAVIRGIDRHYDGGFSAFVEAVR